MSRWGVAALVYLCIPSAWAGTVPGTNWELVAPVRWSEAETGRLEAIASTLPDALRQLPIGPRLVRVEQEMQLSVDHPRVRPLQGGAVLQIWSTAFAQSELERALVHGLMHSADWKGRWSDQPEWKILSGWGEAVLGGPTEQDALTYAGKLGMASSVEDLATAGSLFLVAGDDPRDGCGFRSKSRFLAERLGRESVRPCSSLAQVGLDPESVERLELIYAQPSTRNPGSLAGHLSLGVQYKAQPGSVPRHDVYQLGAGIGGIRPGSAAYVYKGLSGGFPSMISRQPYAKVVMNYGKQTRSLTRLELHLSADQKRRLLERLDDVRQGWDRSYLFLTRNCTYLPVTLVEWALGESLELPSVAGPDVFLGILERRGLITPIPAESMAEFTQLRRAGEAARLMAEAEAELRARSSAHIDALDAVLEQVNHDREEVRVAGYLALTALSPRLLESDLGVYPLLVRILVWAEENERLEKAKSRGKRGGPALAALWKAQAGLLAAASAQGLAPQGTGGASDQLLKVLLLEQTDEEGRPVGRGVVAESSHTSLKRVDLMGGARWADEGVAPSVLFRSTWYRYRLGEARRYAFGEGVDLTGLAMRWHLDMAEVPGHSIDLIPIRLIWIVWHRRVLNPGVYVSLLHLNREVRTERSMRVEVMDLGVPIELWQFDRHRLHLGISGGLSMGANGAGEAMLEMQWKRSLTAPVRLFFRAGSPVEPLNGLEASATWRPSLLDKDVPPEVGAELDGSLRLGALWGTDLALVAAYSVNPGGVMVGSGEPGLAHRATIGLALERY